mgnify:CR=1 FL=1
MKKTLFILLALGLLSAGCAQTPPSVPSPTPAPTDTPLPTSTPDPCGAENIGAEIQKIHRLMREFDDAAALSTYLTRDQLKPTIENLQRIRRDAEDLAVPSCLKPLRELQVTHMNAFIQTLLAFMGGADQETVSQGVALSRQLHDQYMIEMSKLQGVEISLTSTLPAAASPAAESGESPTPSVSVVTNKSNGGINLRLTPTLDGQTVGILAVGQSALALGQTEDGAWILIEPPGQPGQTAWVYAKLVHLSGPLPLTVRSEQ